MNKPVRAMPKKSRNPFLSEKYVYVSLTLCRQPLHALREALSPLDPRCGCREGMLPCPHQRAGASRGHWQSTTCPCRSLPIVLIPGVSSSKRRMQCRTAFFLNCLPRLSSRQAFQSAGFVSCTEGQTILEQHSPHFSVS